MIRALTALAALAAALAVAPAALAATFTVTNGNDSGAGSLRQAVTSANTTPGADSISFASPQTVTLTTTKLTITDAVTIDGGGSSTVASDGTVGPLFDVAASNVTIKNLTLRKSSSDGVRIESGTSAVTVSRTPIYDVAGKEINRVGGGGIDAPSGLRVGPRQANGTLPITGSTGPAGTLELYRGDPATSDAFWFDAAVGGGAFSVLAPAEPSPGETVSATITSGGDTSEWATTTVPNDIVSPWIAGAVATSYNLIRVQPSEPVDPATVQPEDFSVHMAGVDRPITSASVSSDGSILIYSPNQWGPGDAGMIHLATPGAIADQSGNLSLRTDEVHVGGAPGDFIPPVVTSFRLSPKSRLCLYPKPRCRRTGAAIIFRSSEDGDTWITVVKGTRLIGRRKFVAQPGDNFIRFDGKIRGRRLSPGRYKMWVGVEDIVGNLTPINLQPHVTFSVKKPRRLRHR